MYTTNNEYRLSFTACGLLPKESVLLANLYLASKDWSLTLQTVLDENLLQARLQSTLKRITLELLGRLQTLSEDELSYLTTCEQQDRNHLLWIAICRHYTFIAAFANNVIRGKLSSFDLQVRHQDFDLFFDEKSDNNSKLQSISDSTRGKLRQVLFKMLKDANLLTSKNEINKVFLSPELLQILRPNAIKDVQFFPIQPEEIKRILTS